MPKFKVGDKARIDPDHTYLRYAGKVVEIMEVFPIMDGDRVVGYGYSTDMDDPDHGIYTETELAPLDD